MCWYLVHHFGLSADSYHALVYGIGVCPTGSLIFSTSISIVTCWLLTFLVSYGGVLPLAFEFALGQWKLSCLQTETCGYLPYLHNTKQGGPCYWAKGSNFKTVLVISFQGFPNRCSPVGFIRAKRVSNLHFGLAI